MFPRGISPTLDEQQDRINRVTGSFTKKALLPMTFAGLGLWIPAHHLYLTVEDFTFGLLASSERASQLSDLVGWIVGGGFWLTLFLWMLGRVHGLCEAADQYALHGLYSEMERDRMVAEGPDDPRPLRYGWHRTNQSASTR